MKKYLILITLLIAMGVCQQKIKSDSDNPVSVGSSLCNPEHGSDIIFVNLTKDMKLKSHYAKGIVRKLSKQKGLQIKASQSGLFQILFRSLSKFTGEGNSMKLFEE